MSDVWLWWFQVLWLVEELHDDHDYENETDKVFDEVYEPFNELVELNQIKMINFVSLRSATWILENLSLSLKLASN